MNREEALRIIREENLTNYKWFGDKWVGNQTVIAYITHIYFDNEKWVTCVIGERNGVIENSELYFDSEEDAMDDFIRRVRLGKKIIESQKIRNAEKALKLKNERSLT